MARRPATPTEQGEGPTSAEVVTQADKEKKVLFKNESSVVPDNFPRPNNVQGWHVIMGQQHSMHAWILETYSGGGGQREEWSWLSVCVCVCVWCVVGV